MEGVISCQKKKYSTELKLEIVKKYLEGNIGLKQLAEEYNLSTKADIQKWLAAYEHHVLEVMNCDKSSKKTALREIRYVAKTDKTANGFGEKMWLKDWYKIHPKDRWI